LLRCALLGTSFLKNAFLRNGCLVLGFLQEFEFNLVDKNILQLRELRLIYPINKVANLGLFLFGFYISKVNNERSQPNHVGNLAYHPQGPEGDSAFAP
jgi:hypothetical protein